MGIIAFFTIIVGLALTILGFIAYRSSQDPLGYAPPGASLLGSIGMLILSVGLVLAVLAGE